MGSSLTTTAHFIIHDIGFGDACLGLRAWGLQFGGLGLGAWDLGLVSKHLHGSVFMLCNLLGATIVNALPRHKPILTLVT